MNSGCIQAGRFGVAFTIIYIPEGDGNLQLLVVLLVTTLPLIGFLDTKTQHTSVLEKNTAATMPVINSCFGICYLNLFIYTKKKNYVRLQKMK